MVVHVGLKVKPAIGVNEQLDYVSHARLALRFNGSLRLRRQLQNGRLLALAQSFQEYTLCKAWP